MAQQHPFSLFIHFSMLRLPAGTSGVYALEGLNLFALTYLLSLDGE